METDISLAAIELAARTIDPMFTGTPQFADEQLSAALGRQLLIKIETANPIRSFKGRGADFFMQRLDASQHVVCASTGNFGQAIAYAGRARGIAVHVFLPTNANPVKVDRIRAFGAQVTVVGGESAGCEEAARDHVAANAGAVLVEDGKEPAIAEGAGTIGVELLRSSPIDTVVIPVGDGALISGVARWVKEHSPRTRIVGVCASGAPSMVLSWRAATRVCTEGSNTIADGLEVTRPTTEAVARVRALVDDMVLVDDDALIEGMRLAARTIGLLIEPSAAAGFAAIRSHNVPGERLATIVTGSNVRRELLRHMLE